MSLFLVASLTASSACRQRPAASEQKAAPYARRIIGQGQEFQPSTVNQDLIKSSFLARRQEGWRIVKEALRAASVSPTLSSDLVEEKIPLFQTWYDAREFQDMVRYLYKCQLSSDQRKSVTRAPANFIVPPGLVSKTLGDHQKRKLPSTWSAERFRQVLDQLRNSDDLAGLNGVEGTGVSLFSPALIRHYLEELAAVYQCADAGIPGSPPDAYAQCFSKPFPNNAVAAKTTFNRQTIGAARFDTSAAGLTSIFSSTVPFKINRWRAQSPPVEKFESPDGMKKVYSVHFREAEQDYGTFLLTGLHITTKEIPQWLWVTIWWSDSPSTDFGEDRPADFSEGIDPRFGNYKMCVTTDFEETDPLINSPTLDGSDPQFPSLVEAARAANRSTQSASWCSNPFIEHMPHGARSNCIGCHQKAGINGVPTATDSHPPELHKVTNRFPADLLASFHGGMRDDFQGSIQEVVASVDAEGDNLDLTECHLDQ